MDKGDALSAVVLTIIGLWLMVNFLVTAAVAAIKDIGSPLGHVFGSLFGAVLMGVGLYLLAVVVTS